MAQVIGLTPIDAPFAEPPRLGLLRTVTAAEAQADSQGNISVGFTLSPENCGQSGVGNPDICNEDNDKEIPGNAETVEVWPVYAWAGDKCSAFDFRTRDWAARARRQLAATISYQVAHELWTGDQTTEQGDGNRFLASPDADEVTTTPVDAADALGRLEQALADCVKGQRGVIHATRAYGTALADHGLIRREGNMLLTALDTIVIVDAGYDGSSPDGEAAAPGSVWAYASGLPIVRTGPVSTLPDTLADALDRATNTVEYRAEQQFAVGWDGCCHLAAEVNIGWPALGGS